MVSGKWFLQALVIGVGECGPGDAGEGGNQVLHLLQGGDPLGDAATTDCLCDGRLQVQGEQHVCFR